MDLGDVAQPGDKAMDWVHVCVFSGRQPEELSAVGVRPGARVRVHRSNRRLAEFGTYLGCYFMDGRAAPTALLQAARLLAGQDALPAGDVHLVFPTNEEIGGVGGLLR